MGIYNYEDETYVAFPSIISLTVDMIKPTEINS